MISFKELLTEAEAPKPTKLGHLSHLHRLMNIFPKEQNTEEEKSYGGHLGIGTTHDFLEKFHDFLRGKSVPNKYTFTEKMEGAPSFLVRKYGGVTSVAYKGAAGNPDKMVSSDEEIEKAYGHAPGLVKKLKEVRDHAGKVLPDSQVIYQGDHMGSPEDVKDEGTHWSTQPNTVRTHFDKSETPPTAKLMMSLHTMYDRGGAKPIDRKTRQSFGSHPDVLNIDPTISVNPANYTPEEQAAFASHMENARKAYEKIKPEDEEFLKRHGDDMEMFINRSIREGIEPSHENYIAHLNERSAKRIAGLKSEKGRTAESLKHSDKLKDAVENRKVFDAAMQLMQHNQAAGEVLRRVAAKNSKHLTSINGEASDPEGVVYSRKNSDGTTTMAKTTNPFFTEVNLRGGGNISKAKAQPVQESLGATTSDDFRTTPMAFRQSVHIEPRAGSEQIPVRTNVAAKRNLAKEYAATHRNPVNVRTEEVGLEEAKSKKKVLAYVRMNPIHEGHGEVVKAVTGEAQRTGADHEIIMSHSQDAKKNPLSPAQKLKHARRAFPGVNFSVSNPSQPNLLSHLSKAYSDGYREVTIVGGSDRDAFSDLAVRYKGQKGPHGFYGNDMKINFKQAGANRTEDGGVASYSASKMRDAAAKNDFQGFKAMAPKSMKDQHVKDMFNDTRSGMRLTESTSFKGFVEFLREEDYEAQKGDSLWKIAKRNKMSLDDLIKLNPEFKADPSKLAIGQKIKLKGVEEPKVAPIPKERPSSLYLGQNFGAATPSVVSAEQPKPVEPPKTQTTVATPPERPIAPNITPEPKRQAAGTPQASLDAVEPKRKAAGMTPELLKPHEPKDWLTQASDFVGGALKATADTASSAASSVASAADTAYKTAVPLHVRMMGADVAGSWAREQAKNLGIDQKIVNQIPDMQVGLKGLEDLTDDQRKIMRQTLGNVLADPKAKLDSGAFQAGYGHYPGSAETAANREWYDKKPKEEKPKDLLGTVLDYGKKAADQYDPAEQLRMTLGSFGVKPSYKGIEVYDTYDLTQKGSKSHAVPTDADPEKLSLFGKVRQWAQGYETQRQEPNQKYSFTIPWDAYDDEDWKKLSQQYSTTGAPIPKPRPDRSKLTEELKKHYTKRLNSGRLNETYTSAVRGLGYVTGEPATPENDIQQYYDNNAKQVNQINDSLSKQINDTNLSGQKAFDPKEVKNGRTSFKYWEHDENGNPFMIDLMRKRQR